VWSHPDGKANIAPPLPQRNTLPIPEGCAPDKENVLTADAKEVAVGNGAEETFRNQDNPKVRRFAAESNYTIVIRGLFLLRTPAVPHPSPSGERPNLFGTSFADPL
jgi:hypothetical protein